MLNTIFKKQFFYFMGTLIISFLLLGMSLGQAFKTFFEHEKRKTLTNQGKKINILIQNQINDYYDGDIFNDAEFLKKLKNEQDNMYKYLNIDSVIVDKDFVIINASSGVIKSLDANVKIPPIPEMKDGVPKLIMGNLGGLFREDQITVGSPIMIGNKFFGATLMNSSVPELDKSVTEITKVTTLLLFASGAMAFALIYMSSRSISKPIRKMNEIVKEISGGDFEKRVNIETEDEVGQLAISINSMAESLQKQEVQRRNFVANMSHDLRSPLTSMGGFLQAILDGTIPKEAHEKYIRIILEETNRLSKLANDILDINKLQVVDLECSVFDINEVIRKTVIQLENRILEKNIDFKVEFADDKYMVNADEEKIHRVIYNLLDNALKFTEEKGIICISTYKKDKKVYISVKDSGIGINEDQAKHVFDRFYKADSSRGKDKVGSGLGLSITREFIKAHGENIVLNSKINEGSEFIFSLPMVVDTIK